MTCRKAVSQSALPQRRSYSYPETVVFLWQSCHKVDLQTTCRKAVLQSACHKGGLTTSLPPWWSYGSHATNWTYRRHALQFSRHTGGLTASLPPLWSYGSHATKWTYRRRAARRTYNPLATKVVLQQARQRCGLMAVMPPTGLTDDVPQDGLKISLPQMWPYTKPAIVVVL